LTSEASLKGWRTRRWKRVAELEAKAAKRRNTPGMSENVAEIDAEIARLRKAGV
jgi:hypothetical protein